MAEIDLDLDQTAPDLDNGEELGEELNLPLAPPVESNAPQNERPKRHAEVPARLHDYELFQDSEIGNDGELIHMTLLADVSPVSFDEAIVNKTWRKAMKEELVSIEKNETWELVELPANKRPISVKWVFKVKLNPNGSISRHKARLVVRGFMQKEGLDYSEVFAPVARMETIRLLVALASWRGWKLWQLDVKSAFLNGPLEEEVYITQPPGFELKGSEDKVLKLKKALYGLKQAPRAWNKRIDAFLSKTGFRKCSVEHGLYVKKSDSGGILLICLYVDDLLITGSSSTEIAEIKRCLSSEFEMTDLGKLSYFLGIEFEQNNKGILMHQRKYILEILERFNML